MAVSLDTASGILNESLDALGYAQDAKIPLASSGASDTEIENAYKAIGVYPESQKNALLQQANAILIFRNYGTMFDASKNPMRRFWRDMVNYGGGIEDIYHEIITPLEGYSQGDHWAEEWADVTYGTNDDTYAQKVAGDLVKFYQYDVKKNFTTAKGTFTLPLSITELEVSKIFTPEGFTRYIDTKMANLMWSAEVKLQNISISCMKKMVDDGNIIFAEGNDLSTQMGIANFVELVQTCSDSMQNLSSVFNKAEVLGISSPDDLYFVTTPDLINRIRVQGYANAYNLKEFALRNSVITLPFGTNFGTYNNHPVIGILIDRRAIVLAIRYWKMKNFIPANTDWSNYFLKCQYIKGYNTFFNAVAFTSTETVEAKSADSRSIEIEGDDDAKV